MNSFKRKLSLSPESKNLNSKQAKVANIDDNKHDITPDGCQDIDNSSSQSETGISKSKTKTIVGSTVAWLKSPFGKKSAETKMGRKSKRSNTFLNLSGKSSNTSSASTPEKDRTLARLGPHHSTPNLSATRGIVTDEQRRILRRFRPILPKPEGKDNKIAAIINRYENTDSFTGFKPSAEDHRRPAPGYVAKRGQ
jgi:hypothetical protein